MTPTGRTIVTGRCPDCWQRAHVTKRGRIAEHTVKGTGEFYDAPYCGGALVRPDMLAAHQARSRVRRLIRSLRARGRSNESVRTAL